MNYLAHTLLCPKHIDYQLSNIVADTIKGREWPGCSDYHRDGLLMHKAIDRFTDESPIVDRAITRLGSGYLKGVIIDITFDHFLSQHWSRFVCVSQQRFINTFYAEASNQLNRLPDNGQAFIKTVINNDILNAYHDFDDLAVVLTRVNRRLSDKLREKESATDYLPRLAAKYSALEQDFLDYFPTLVSMFLQKNRANPRTQDLEHYFKDLD